jgi:acyl-coenzyme A thioesterase PaaI-like protein
MAVDDSLQSVLSIPWIASHIAAPDIVVGIPGCRYPKASTEDTLLAESLKTSSSLRTCLYFYLPPSPDSPSIPAVSTVMTLGSGMNGHSHILHGGMVATLLDESMGIYTSCNEHRAYFEKNGVKKKDKGQTPKFTAELKVTYLKPVRTPTTLVVEVRSVRKEGRKEWMVAEMRQEQDGGEVVLCARGEGLFVEARGAKI